MSGNPVNRVAPLALARDTVMALAVMFIPQGIWSALITLNLRTTPRIPWAVVVVIAAGVLVIRTAWRRGERETQSRRSHAPPRAIAVRGSVLRWSAIAGGCAMVALAGLWIVLASVVRMPGTVLPDFSQYPWWTVWLAVAAGAAISPLCEQIALWGYWQVVLERAFPARVAMLLTALLFAVLPHPPVHAVLWPKWLFFFATGLTFSTMAYVTDSIVPGLAVHAVSLLTFFVLVWPYDPQRHLLAEGGADDWFVMHVGQTIVFGIACVWAFGRLRRAAASTTRRTPVGASLNAPGESP